MFRTRLICSTAIAVVAVAAPALAQMEEITVTARKVEERLLDTPIAIAAITGDDLAARHIVNLQDLAQNVPGTNVVNQASNGARSDRSFQAVVVRGVAPSSSALQTASIFIDGVPVASSSAVQTITSPERVEVLKGPQSAYFGRQTFAGAINIVNKMPAQEFSGTITGMAATRHNYDVTAELSGPLAGDVLGFRVTGGASGKHGSYANAFAPGTTVGNQSTKTGSLLLVAKPSDDFTVKAFGFLTDKNDGAPAQGLISAYPVVDAGGVVQAYNQSNCIVGRTTANPAGNPFFCGVTPKLTNRTPTQTTALPQVLLNDLRDPAGRVLDPMDGPTTGLGLKARDYHLHLAMDYQLGDITLSSLTGFNKGRWSELADLDNLSSTNQSFFGSLAGYNFYFLIDSISKDFSQELRASYTSGRLHGTVGVSYLYARTQGSSGGNGASYNAPLGTTIGGPTISKTLGVFGGLGYDITDQFSLNFDARYQEDRNLSYAGAAGTRVTAAGLGVAPGFYAPFSKVFEAKYKNFMPRVIGQYKLDPDNMVYASFSKGINPGIFNTGFLSPPANGVNQAAALVAANNLTVVVKPEKLNNYEIGAKGLLADKNIRYELAAYYMQWRDQINQQNFFYIDSVGIVQQLTASTNTGAVNIKGLEANLGFSLAEGLTLDLGGALTDAKIKQGANAATSTLMGLPLNNLLNYTGKDSPLTSKWSGTAALQYIAPLGENGLEGLARVDASFKTGAYTNMANIVKTPSVSNVNLTLGVQNEKYMLQAFMTNVFNNKAYYSAIDGVLVDPSFSHFGTSSSLVVQLREKRTVGVKGSVRF